MLTRFATLGSSAALLTRGVLSWPPLRAATSRASPVMPRQSPRFGVTAISNNQSSRWLCGSNKGTTDSTSSPAIVSNSASFRGGSLIATNSFNQLKVNFIGQIGELEWCSIGVVVSTQHSITPFLLTRTVSENGDHFGRTAGYRRSSISASQSARPPYRTRNPKPVQDRTRQSGRPVG